MNGLQVDRQYKKGDLVEFVLDNEKFEGVVVSYAFPGLVRAAGLNLLVINVSGRFSEVRLREKDVRPL